MTNYTPTPEELQKHASRFWPKEILDKEVSASIIPVLVGTQDKFISILDIADKSPDAWKTVLYASSGLTTDPDAETIQSLHTARRNSLGLF
jgi:hypothetical protein